MPKLRTTFSIRMLLVFVTLSAAAIFFLTFERTASVRLPPTAAGKIDSARLRAFESSRILQRVVRATPRQMLPGPVRGDTPNFAWFKHNMSISTDASTNEIHVTISTNQATAAQLQRLLSEISKYRIETKTASSQSRLDRISNWISGIRHTVQSRVADEFLDAGDDIFNKTGVTSVKPIE